MAQVVDGRYTARMDEPFAVFISRETPRLQMSPGQSCTRLSQDHRSEIRARRRDGAQH
jgi:hypothetical protein